MSEEYHVKLKDLKCSPIPFELLYAADNGRLQIGTSFANQDRENTLANLIREQLGEFPAGKFSAYEDATIEELTLSDKPYFSKWDKSSPIEFFNTITHFSWYLPVHIMGTKKINDATEEDFAEKMLHFWDSILDDYTLILHSSLHPIETWADLKGAVFGIGRYMEPSKFVEGTLGRYTLLEEHENLPNP